MYIDICIIYKKRHFLRYIITVYAYIYIYIYAYIDLLIYSHVLYTHVYANIYEYISIHVNIWIYKYADSMHKYKIETIFLYNLISI